EKAEVIRPYGGGSGDIFLDGLSCTGHETSVRDCSWRGKGGPDDGIGQLRYACSHALDVGVDCG
ncbi:hypothetical protein BaRGS_00030063, partial [Batillaria attramentaria]